MMSFDKELRVVMISSIGIFVYLIIASAIMSLIYLNFGEFPFLVAWLVVLLIPINFTVCSLVCMIVYKRKERNFKRIQAQLSELSELTIECEKKRDDKTEKIDKLEKVTAKAAPVVAASNAS